jgi:DNA polymerase III psi subunit
MEYELKQTPSSWYSMLNTKLRKLDLDSSKALFVSTYRLYNLNYNLDCIIWIICSGLNKLGAAVC